MAAEWHFDTALQRGGAERVCVRVYEELDDFTEEVHAMPVDTPYDALQALYEFMERLNKTLPFDPEDVGC